MPYWLQTFSTGATDVNGQPAITATQQSEIVSLLSAGTFFGALLSAPMGDITGRRMGLILSSFVFIFGVILQTAATAIPLFVTGRFFAGLGVGLISALVPLYQSESLPKWIRGAVVGSYQFAITVGLFIAAIVDYATQDRRDTGSYRIPIAVQFAWALIMITGMLFLPETPRYYIKMGKNEKACKSLSRLRRLNVDHPALVEEIAEIQANHEYELSLGKASYIDCFRGTLGKRLATGCLLQALQQLTGVNFIFYYGTSFFKSSGIGNPFIISVITDVVNVTSTLPGLYMIEKWGRRPMLFWGAVGMFVCQMIVAATGTAFYFCVATNTLTIFRYGLTQQCRRQQGSHRLRLRLYLLLRLYLGPHRLGCDWRDFPAQGPRQVPVDDDGDELASQLGNRLRDPVFGQLRPWQRQSAGQGVFHLGRVLLDLRNLCVSLDLREQGSVARAGGRDVCKGESGVEEHGFCAFSELPGGERFQGGVEKAEPGGYRGECDPKEESSGACGEAREWCVSTEYRVES